VRLWVKVCGLRTVAAIEAAVDAGADAIGFVFHPSSPRNLEFGHAGELSRSVPSGIIKVAVFRHPSQALLDAALAALRPDCVQADAADFAQLHVPSRYEHLPVYRSGQPGVRPADVPAGKRFLDEGADSGAAERADWAEAARLATHGDLVLAGGLDARNVGDAVLTVRPFGVDVSSGVERVRGEKDPGLIREFVTAARAAEALLARRASGG
jgi:phosphoribosylanthranilate isomerase